MKTLLLSLFLLTSTAYADTAEPNQATDLAKEIKRKKKKETKEVVRAERPF